MDSLIGQNIRKYQILSKLGSGGMGSVFHSKDTILERNVALKLLAPTLANDDSFVERFRLEARSLARLDHPHIVKVYDADWDENKLFIVMEYVDGGSLADLIKQEGALPPALTIKLLQQTASGLDYAHQRGLIHRDIKPANILIDSQGNAKLTDFGLVKDTGTSLTADGTRLGTPAYMAPEQIQGEEVTSVLDVYALAIVAYEMLTGRPPFQGNMSSIFEGHLLRQVPSITQINPALPVDAQYVLVKALAKNPAERHPTASSFVQALGGALHLEERPSGAVTPAITIVHTGTHSPGEMSPGGPGSSGGRYPQAGSNIPVDTPPPGYGQISQPISGQSPPQRRSGAGSFLSGLGLGAVGVVVILVLGLLCLCAGCYLVASNVPDPTATSTMTSTETTVPPTETASPTLEPTATLAPTDTPTTEPTAPPVILFQDDFSNPGSADWLQIRDQDGITDYEQDGYRIRVEKTDWLFWSTPNLSFTDVHLEVDIQKLGGPDLSEFGLLCRYIDADNFYFSTARSDGFYSIGKYVNDDFVTLTNSYEATDLITKGNATNHLGMDCIGDTLSLYINGQLVDSVNDSEFTTGDVGVIVGTFDVAGADVLFDNFIVYQP